MAKTLSTKKRLFKRLKDKIQPQAQEQSPKINRTIPEPTSLESFDRELRPNRLRWPSPFKKYLSLKNGILASLIVLGLGFLIWSGILLFQSYTSWSKLISQREKLTEKMHLWENIAKAYPNYTDAYIEGEIYAYMLGDRQKEQYFLNKLKLLDPNSPLIKTFEQLERLQGL